MKNVFQHSAAEWKKKKKTSASQSPVGIPLLIGKKNILRLPTRQLTLHCRVRKQMSQHSTAECVKKLLRLPTRQLALHCRLGKKHTSASHLPGSTPLPSRETEWFKKCFGFPLASWHSTADWGKKHTSASHSPVDTPLPSEKIDVLALHCGVIKKHALHFLLANRQFQAQAESLNLIPSSSRFSLQKKGMEDGGIDPPASRVQGERSTI